MYISTLLLSALFPLSLASVMKRNEEHHHRENPSGCPGPHPISTSTVSLTTSTSTSTTSSTATPTPFTIIAAHSTSPIHLQSVNAANGFFFIGISPKAICPLKVPSDCPPGTSTTFIVADGSASLAVLVPAGQRIYVLPTGALSFTEPHVATFPPGAVTLGFSQTPGPSFGFFSFTGLGATGLVACPTAAKTGPYQVYAQVAGFVAPNANACIGFDALTSGVGGPGAFEYV